MQYEPRFLDREIRKKFEAWADFASLERPAALRRESIVEHPQTTLRASRPRDQVSSTLFFIARRGCGRHTTSQQSTATEGPEPHADRTDIETDSSIKWNDREGEIRTERIHNCLSATFGNNEWRGGKFT